MGAGAEVRVGVLVAPLSLPLVPPLLLSLVPPPVPPVPLLVPMC